MNYTNLSITQIHLLHKSMYYTNPCITQTHLLHKSMYYTNPCITQIHVLHRIYESYIYMKYTEFMDHTDI